MKKLYTFLAVLLLCQIVAAQQQNEAATYHRGGNPENHPGQSFSGNSGTGANIDVTYHRCDWNINPVPTSKIISGTVTTYFKTIAANVNNITFDLNSGSFDNASLVVHYHGIVCSKTFSATNILSITLPVTLPLNRFDSISITYSGTPPAVNANAEGYQRKLDGSDAYIYTLSESYEDRDWWPCKADMQDKIDSLDMNVTVPTAYWVAGPGKLIDSSAISGTEKIFKYKHRYPITSYLVALGIAKYNRYHRGTVNISGKNVPVVYYLFPSISGTTLTNTLARLDVSKQELVEFSNRFGPYPFADEKHGYYQFGWGGGMEHQSFSAMGSSALGSWSTIAHELGHQWFGDKVSFATWNHLWLAEGFAKYSEVIAAEAIPAIGVTPASHLSAIKTTARARNNTPIQLSTASIANSNTIWTTANDEAVYQRGAMVVSMLRATLGDTKFYQGLKNYIADPLLAYKSATTADLERNMENQAGVDMSSFFTAWINGAGTPSYTGQYYINGKYIQFKFTQSRVGGSVSHFPMPIVLRIANSTGTKDTTVVIYHYTATSLGYAGDGIGIAGKDVISYNLSFIPSNITFDPDNVTMATGTMNLSTTLLATDVVDFKARRAGNVNRIDLNVSSDEVIQKIILLKSVNGVDFVEAGEMMNNGISGNRTQYSINDNNPYSPVTFYKAKIITATKTSFSGIAKVQAAVIKKMTISPNPAIETINISFNNEQKESTIIRVMSIDGKKLFESTTTNDFIRYDVSNLSAGTYMVQVIQHEEVNEVAKFLVSK